MTTKKTWAIWAYSVGAICNGGFIESSVGKPYRELGTIARRMCSNGEGMRYTVREYSPPVVGSVSESAHVPPLALAARNKAAAI